MPDLTDRQKSTIAALLTKAHRTTINVRVSSQIIRKPVSISVPLYVSITGSH